MTKVGRTEDAVVDRLRELRVVPVATVPAARAASLGEVLVRAGLPCVEIAFRNEDALAALAVAAANEDLLVGAGTVLTPAQAEAAAAAGADFAVSPSTNEAVSRRCGELGLPFFPGVATPSEIDHACRLGHRTVKFFPAEALGGPRFIRSVSATYPHMRFVPTGGVSAANVREYLDLPCVLACGGSWVATADDIRNGRFDVIEERAREAVRIATS